MSRGGRGGLEWRGAWLPCSRWLGPSAALACDGCNPDGAWVEKVDTDEKDQPPTLPLGTTVNMRERTNPSTDPHPYFHGTHAPSPLPTTAPPGKTTSERRASPTRFLPSGAPPRGSIYRAMHSSATLRNVQDGPRSSQATHPGPHSSTTRGIGAFPKASASAAAASWPHWSGKQASSIPSPHPACRTAKFALFMRQPVRWSRVVRQSPAVAEWTIRGSTLPPPASVQQERPGGRPSTLDRVPVIGSRPFCATAIAPSPERHHRPVLDIDPSSPTTSVVFHLRAGTRSRIVS